jgi:hypothetical protein
MSGTEVAVCLASLILVIVDVEDGPTCDAKTFNCAVLHSELDGAEDCVHDEWFHPSWLSRLTKLLEVRSCSKLPYACSL